MQIQIVPDQAIANTTIMDTMKQPYVPLPVQLPDDIYRTIVSMKTEAEDYDMHKVKYKTLQREHEVYYNKMLISKLDMLIYDCEVAHEELSFCSNEDYIYYNGRLEMCINKVYDFQEVHRNTLMKIYYNTTRCVCEDMCVANKPCTCSNILKNSRSLWPNKKNCYCYNQKKVLELASCWSRNIIPP